MTGVDAAGDLATASLWGRAAEPAAGELHAGEPPERCLNCGARLVGPFCHACGQGAHIHSTLASLVHDLLHGAFHFEGKVWRTLPMLAVRPGQLTRRYIAGERARFVSPLAMFLFSVFLMFAAFEMLGPPLHPSVQVQQNGRTLNRSELDAADTAAKTQVAQLEALRQAALRAHNPTTDLDRKIASARDEMSSLDTGERLTRGATDPMSLAPARVRTGWGTLDERIEAARANPELLVFQLQANAHKFAWALIPISVPFLWLMFAWRREYRLYDHVVFVTYSLSAVMLLLVAMAALGTIGLRADPALMLVPVHFFLQLRGAYLLGWWGALWRTVGLVVAASASIAIFAALLVLIGVAG